MSDTSDALWSIEDIASYLQRSVRRTRRIVRTAGFPAPSPLDQHRWPAQAVITAATGRAPEPVAETNPTVLHRREGTGRIERRRRRAA